LQEREAERLEDVLILLMESCKDSFKTPSYPNKVVNINFTYSHNFHWSEVYFFSAHFDQLNKQAPLAIPMRQLAVHFGYTWFAAYLRAAHATD
jgi:hypothetical protein